MPDVFYIEFTDRRKLQVVVDDTRRAIRVVRSLAGNAKLVHFLPYHEAVLQGVFKPCELFDLTEQNFTRSVYIQE